MKQRFWQGRKAAGKRREPKHSFLFRALSKMCHLVLSGRNTRDPVPSIELSHAGPKSGVIKKSGEELASHSMRLGDLLSISSLPASAVRKVFRPPAVQGSGQPAIHNVSPGLSIGLVLASGYLKSSVASIGVAHTGPLSHWIYPFSGSAWKRAPFVP